MAIFHRRLVNVLESIFRLSNDVWLMSELAVVFSSAVPGVQLGGAQFRLDVIGGMMKPRRRNQMISLCMTKKSNRTQSDWVH